MNESNTSPGVALLFGDADLGAHLREALNVLGARIVYEGAASQVQDDTLRNCGADVVVVNLEPGEDEHFDRLCAVLDQGGHHVVFNDSEASRDLDGWDKARWARHLAVKLLGSGDVDPPRPTDGRQIEAAQVEVADEPDVSQAVEPHDETADVANDSAAQQEKHVPSDEESAQSEQMSAELESMLAEEEKGSAESHAETPEEEGASGVEIEHRQSVTTPAPVTDWELVDVDTPTQASEPAADEREDASRYGIEKMQASDYLKPEAEGSDNASSIEPGLKLELVDLEESLAPGMVDKTVSEMMLDAETAGIRRVALIGAGSDAMPELGDFLAGLPEKLSTLVVIVQSGQDQHAEAVAEALATTMRLSINVATGGATARPGQVWLVPAGRHCRIERSGRVMLAETGMDAQDDLSIDRTLEALVEVFGADVTAIILSGGGNDALEGTRRLAEHGGQVWIQDPGSCNGGTAMAARIHAAELEVFSGSPSELARHLVEECA